MAYSPTPTCAATKATSWQFGLKHLFGLTTLAAIAAAIFSAVGAGTLVLSLGLILAWLNYCGLFASLQTGRKQLVLLGTAWATFLLSLLLPSVKVFGPVNGASAAWIVLLAPYEALRRAPTEAWSAFLYVVIDMANALMLALPVLIGLLRRNRGHATSATLCSAMVGAWAVGWGEGREMLVGYYVWCLSMMLALVAVPLRIQTLAMMFFLGALCAFVIFYWR